MRLVIALGLLALSSGRVLASILPQAAVVYSYESEINAKADYPSPATSKFSLRGFLTIWPVEGSIHLQLSNLTTSLFNGVIGEDDASLSRFEPLPDAASSLTKPFGVRLTNGSVDGLVGVQGDDEWAVNIKRAVASVLIFDASQLDNPAFVTTESGLYGPCLAEYTSHQEDTTLFLRRYQDHLSCPGRPTAGWTNVPPVEFYCPAGQDNLLASSSQRLYSIQRTPALALLAVDSTAAVHAQPFRARGELQYIFTRQQLLLVKSAGPLGAAPAVSGNTSPLAFQLPGADFTQGRNPLKQASVVAIVKRILKEITAGLDVELGQDPAQLHDERIPQALYFMSVLDRASLEELYLEFVVGTSYHQQTTRQVLMQLLPMIGTPQSILLIKDLVTDKTVKGHTAVSLVQDLPFYVRHPSEELLRQCEVFLEMPEGTSQDLRGVAILAFATMVHKAFASGKCSVVRQELYVQKYLRLFNEAADYKHKMLYLEGLSNLEDGRVFEYLEPMIRSNPDQHIRFLAIWATMNKAFLHADAVFRLYWPILSDRGSSLEMRVAALTMLVVSKPTAGRFFSLHWFMTSEPEPRLRHFYYTTLQSLVNSKDPCYALLSAHAAKVLRLLPAPVVRHWATGNYILDQANTEMGFGGLAQLFLIANPDTDLPNVFYLQLGSHAIGHRFNQMSVYLKLEGISNAVKERLSRIDLASVKLPQLVEVLKQVRAGSATSEPVHLEMLLKRENRVVLAHYLNHTTFHLLADALMKLGSVSQEMHLNMQSVASPILSERTMPTDVGISAMFLVSSTSLASLRGKFSKVATPSSLLLSKETEIRSSAMATNNLAFYNPVLDIWQGVQRSTTFRVVLPFNGGVSLDSADSRLKFNLRRKPGSAVRALAHVRSVVMVHDAPGATTLRRHCDSCLTLVTVTKGGQYREKKQFLDVALGEVGVRLQGDLFDCEHHNGFQALGAAIQGQNYQVFPASRPVLIFFHLMDCWLMVSPPGSCGTDVRLDTDDKHGSELEGSVQLTTEGGRHGVAVSVAHKAGNATQHAWHVNAVYQAGSRFYNLTLNVVREAPGDAQRKLCMLALVKFPTSPSDKLLVRPSQPLTAEATFQWSAADGTSTCAGEPADQLPLQASFVAETTVEQAALARDANVWPFSACKAGDKNACHRAASEMATLRKYAVALNYSSPLEPALFVLGRGADGQLGASVEVSATRPLVHITVGSDRFTLDTGRRWLEPILVNTHYPILEQAAIYLGLISPKQPEV